MSVLGQLSFVSSYTNASTLHTCVGVNAGEFHLILHLLVPEMLFDSVWKFDLGNSYSSALPPNQSSLIMNHLRVRPLEVVVQQAFPKSQMKVEI